MRLNARTHLVGSGSLGFGLSDDFDCHVYLLDGGSELALVDAGAGMGLEMILERIEQQGLDQNRIKKLILTHAHTDHAGGAAATARRLGDVELVAHPETARRLREGDSEAIGLERAKAAGFYPAEYQFESCEAVSEVTDGDVVQVGDLSVEVIETPGHCRGHVALHATVDQNSVLFCGDALFVGGEIFLQNVPDCDLQEQISTLRRLRELAVTSLLPGHLSLSLTNGQRHIERANDALDRLLIPNQLISAW